MRPLDLAQLRGYGLGHQVNELLMLLALYKVRGLLSGPLRFRAACDLKVATPEPITAIAPQGFLLPDLDFLKAAIKTGIAAVKDMKVTEVQFDDEMRRGRSEEEELSDAGADDEEFSGTAG